ncbi:MAG: DEAD/DEAH box helicase [Tepidisphaeraceae bacterium]
MSNDDTWMLPFDNAAQSSLSLVEPQPRLSHDLIEEIERAVLDKGELSKSEIRDAWGIDNEDYSELQERLLEKNQSIRKGRRKIGGFAVGPRQGRPPREDPDGELLLRTEWERRAVQRLTELLSEKQLKDLLGPLVQVIRRARQEETGVDRNATKPQMATALVLQHKFDLFCESKARELIARACRVECPKRWHPGKDTAINFVIQTGFPRDMAGIPTPDILPDYEYLEGRFRLRGLRDFQIEVKDALLERLRTPGERAIVTLPTGAGKTRVAVEAIRDWSTARYDIVAKTTNTGTILWLAHTEELCEQAYTCFKQVWEASENLCPLFLVRFWGRYTEDLAKHREKLQQSMSGPSALISTPQRIINLLDGHVQGSEPVVGHLRHALGLLLVDEAHRAAAPSYRRILTGLTSTDLPVSVVGLTATPFRMEYVEDDPEEGTRELKEIFRKLIEPSKTLGANPRQKLQEMRILARPVLETIQTPTTIRIPDVPTEGLLSEEDSERIDRAMAVKADNATRRLAILKRLLPLAQKPDYSILYFGPTVRDAECMTYLLRREGITAAVVSGDTREVTRRQVVAEFKEGTIRVLCNCEVLTTGFDAPRVTHIVMARPTVSRVLYEQIIGRGLRGPEFGGTETCVILDCEDTFRGDRPPLGYESFRRIWQPDFRSN